MDNKTLKIIGTVATIAGFGLSLVSSWVGDKKLEGLVDKKVSEKIEKLTNK